MFAIVLLASIGIAWLRGGRPARMLRLEFRHLELLGLSFLCRLLLLFGPALGWEEVLHFALALQIVSYGFLVIAIVLNRHWGGWPYLALGAAANGLVIAANGGRMPVSEWALRATGQADLIPHLAGDGDFVHTLLHAGTRLPFLADVLALPAPFPRPVAFSPGDVLIWFGLFLLVQRAMLPASASLFLPASGVRSRVDGGR